MPSKRYKRALEVVDANKAYPLKDAVGVLAKFPKAKFNETIDLAFRLGVDPKQSDQMVRGTCPLPNGSGKNVRVLVFATGQAAEAAKEAGAEIVGFEDIIKKVTGGFSDFDVAIATPADGNSYTCISSGLELSAGVKVSVSVPAPGIFTSVARY